MTGKKSFILYSDFINIVEKLPNEAAGKLFKTILEYVNDRNPIVDDLLLQIAFEPIRLQLKRDLGEWVEEKTNRSESGRLGNIKRWYYDLYLQIKAGKISLQQAENIIINRKASLPDKINRPRSQSIANIAVTDTVTVTDTVNVNFTATPHFKEILKMYGFESEMNFVARHQELNSMLSLLNYEGRMDHFTTQWKFYKLFIEFADNKKYLMSWIKFHGGGWDAENWKMKFEEAKKPKHDKNSTGLPAHVMPGELNKR